MKGMEVEPLTSLATCNYQVFNQLTTLLYYEKICETLLLISSISNFFDIQILKCIFFFMSYLNKTNENFFSRSFKDLFIDVHNEFKI